MSLIKAIKAQLGLSVTPANNFTLDASADNGTMKLARGNAGATTQDIMTVDANGGVKTRGGTTVPPVGFIGELLTATDPPVNLGAAAAVWNLTSVILTPGVWDVQTYGFFTGTQNATMIDLCLSAASVTMQELSRVTIGWHSGNIASRISGRLERIVVTANTQYWCCARAQASADVSCTGTINARRVA
jgi:hypothetical protein